MAETLGTVELGIQVTGSEQAQQELINLGNAAAQAGQDLNKSFKSASLEQLETELKKIQTELKQTQVGSTAFEALSRQAAKLKQEIIGAQQSTQALKISFSDIAAAAGIGTGVAELIAQIKNLIQQTAQTSIEFERAGTRLRALSSSFGEYAQVQAIVAKNAQALNLSQVDAANAFAQVYGFLRPVGVQLGDIQTAYNATTLAIKNLGGTSSEISGVLLQLSQAFAKGKLDGDELRSILERFPPLTAALTKVFDNPTKSLTQLGAEGLLTRDKLLQALSELEKTELIKFQDTLNTAGAAQDRLKNSFQDLSVTVANSTAIKLFLDGLALAINTLDSAISSTQRQIPNLISGLNDIIKEVTGFDSLKQAASYWEALIKEVDKYKKLLQQLGVLPAEIKLPKLKSTGGGDDPGLIANSIDGITARLKAQRDELNKVEIGSQRFQQLTQDVKNTEDQLKAATEAAKGTRVILSELQRVSTQGIDFRQQDIGLAQSRLDIVRQVAQAEQDVASARLSLEGALLNAQEKRALEGVQSEAQRQQIIEDFQRKREDLEAKQFAIREQSTKLELQQKLESLKLEQQITELAAQRGVIQARIAVAQASRTGDPNQIAAAQEGLQLAERELQLAKQIGNEKLAAQQRINDLRLQQLELEKKTAQADNLPPLPKPLAAGNGIIEFKIDPTPVDRNSQIVGEAAQQIGNSNQTLVDQIDRNTQAVENLANKDWSVYAVLPDNPDPVPLVTP